MYRLTALPRQLPRSTQTLRAFSMSALRATEGSTGSGSSRPGGTAQGDAFSKREKANEDMYVREQEMAKIKKLREDLNKKKQELDELHNQVETIEKGMSK